MTDKPSSRREFLGKQAGIAAVSSSLLSRAHGKEPKFVPKANTRVLGANDRINVGFIGNGMQFNALMDRAFFARQQKKADFEFAAVCDVWEPRVKYAQERTKAQKTYRDYREVLSRPDIDGVVIAVPDHWHYLIASHACQSGKDVYLEKPMTYTIPEAAKLTEIVADTKRVLQVGGSGPSTRLYWKINEYIRSGKMGKVVWGLISYNRNTREGMWDYPIPGVGSDHWPDAKVTPENLDWDMWLGPAPNRKYSHERYFRWRKYWDYSGGNATDLLYHRLGMMSTMIGFDFPTRVMGAGGIYVQKNREVPDTYMTLIEYPGDYAVNMVSCMANQQSVPMTVYSNWATLAVGDGQVRGNAMGDQRAAAPPAPTARRGGQSATVRAERQFTKEFQAANDGKTEITIESEPSTDLVDDWLDCMRSRATPVYNATRGYQVMVAIGLGVESYKNGRVMAFDPETKRILPAPPKHKEYLPQDA
jgi:predicted dehydrogenase